MPDYTLSARITGNSDGFTKAFEGAQKTLASFEGKAKGIGSKISSVGDALTSKITKPAAAATTALVGVTLVKGFNRLVGIDDARAKLAGLGYDAQSVETIMDSALKSVQGTSFGLDEAATTAANAVAAGIKPGKELTKYLGMTADAAAIAGVSLGEMGSILNKVQTGQTVYTEDLEQLADRGLPVYQWIGEAAGVAASEVKQMASEGKISSEMLFSAIEKNIGGAAQIMGDKSFSAAVANIGASIARIGANFLDAGGKGGGFFSQLKPLMKEFNENLGTLEGKASELGVKFGQAFASMVQKVKEIKARFDELSPATQEFILKAAGIGAIIMVSLGPALKVIGNITTAVGLATGAIKTMIGVANGIDQAAGKMLQFGKNVQIVKSAMSGGFTGPLTADQQKIANFAKSAQINFGKVKNAAMGVRTGVAQGLSSLGSTLSTAGSSIVGLASRVGTSLMTMGTSMATAIAPFLPAIAVFAALAAAMIYLFNTNEEFRNSVLNSWEQIKAAFVPVGEAFTTMLTQVADALMPAIQELGAAFATLISSVTPIISLFAGAFASALGITATIFAQLVSNIAPLVAMLISSLAPVITTIANVIGTIVTAIASALIPIVNTIVSILSTVVIPAITAVITTVASVITRIIQTVTPIVTFIAGIIAKIISTIATIISKVASIFNTVRTTIQTVWKNISSVIKSVITTIINIIKTVLGPVKSVFNSVRSVIVGVFNKIKSAWSGLTSFVSGVFNGIAGAVETLVSEVKGFVNGVIGGINGAIGIINKIPKVNIPKIPKLAHGTDNWQGGFAVMNEGGRGELVHLPNGSQVIPHDVSVKYAKEAARNNSTVAPLDMEALGAYIVRAVSTQGEHIADGLEKGIGNMRMVSDKRETARFIADLGFAKG